jgi:hypothetical protein
MVAQTYNGLDRRQIAATIAPIIIVALAGLGCERRWQTPIP